MNEGVRGEVTRGVSDERLGQLSLIAPMLRHGAIYLLWAVYRYGM